MTIKFNQKIKNPEVKYFVTSDLHFYHKNILEFCPDTRPWGNVGDMNQGLIDHWNTQIGEDDVVLHLGDFSFGNKEQTQSILEQLNGNVVHLYGNHSKALRDQLCVYGFDYLEFSYKGIKVICNHYAQRVWNRSHFGSVHLFGHSHGSLEGIGRSMDVGFDAHGRILTLDEALDMCMIKDIHKEDHH